MLLQHAADLLGQQPQPLRVGALQYGQQGRAWSRLAYPSLMQAVNAKPRGQHVLCMVPCKGQARAGRNELDLHGP